MRYFLTAAAAVLLMAGPVAAKADAPAKGKDKPAGGSSGGAGGSGAGNSGSAPPLAVKATPVTLAAGEPVQFAVAYEGFVERQGVPGLGAASRFEFAGVADEGRRWDFRILSLDNISSLPSRLSVFGFDVSSAPVKVSAEGRFDEVSLAGNVPTLGTRSVCFRESGGSCAGGGGGGLTRDAAPLETGGFSLFFGVPTRSITFDNFFVRFQDIRGVAAGTSGVGAGKAAAVETLAAATVPAVPEPAAWAMLVVGFGMVGTLIRRRRAGELVQG